MFCFPAVVCGSLLIVYVLCKLKLQLHEYYVGPLFYLTTVSPLSRPPSRVAEFWWWMMTVVAQIRVRYRHVAIVCRKYVAISDSVYLVCFDYLPSTPREATIGFTVSARPLVFSHGNILTNGDGVKVWFSLNTRHCTWNHTYVYLDISPYKILIQGIRYLAVYEKRAGPKGQRKSVQFKRNMSLSRRRVINKSERVNYTFVFYTVMGTGSFPGVKNGRGVTLTPHPLLVPWPRKSRAIPLLPLWAVRTVQSLSACTRVHFTFYFYLLYCLLATENCLLRFLCISNRAARKKKRSRFGRCTYQEWGCGVVLETHWKARVMRVAPYTLSVKLSDFIVWGHTWRKTE